jgi:SAM-dependent methyltransferase
MRERLSAALSSAAGAPGRLIRAGERRAFPEAQAAPDHWQRLVVNRAVEEYILGLGPGECSAVEISGDAHAARPWKRYASLSYPDFDLCAPLVDTHRYDVVICEQVLEHVVDPWAAVANLRELCTPQGCVIVSTPFLIKIHELPQYGMVDYWRFTPRGLQALLERGGLQVDAVGRWGNRQCVVGNFNRWSARRRWHSLRNEAEFPLQVWAFARRVQ